MHGNYIPLVTYHNPYPTTGSFGLIFIYLDPTSTFNSSAFDQVELLISR